MTRPMRLATSLNIMLLIEKYTTMPLPPLPSTIFFQLRSGGTVDSSRPISPPVTPRKAGVRFAVTRCQ